MKNKLTDIIDERINEIAGSGFEINISEIFNLSQFEEFGISIDNFKLKSKNVLLIETSILVVNLSVGGKKRINYNSFELAKYLSAYITSVSKLVEETSGHIFNIIGDKIYIIFDQLDCFNEAIKVAIKINNFITNNLSLHFKDFNIRPGLGLASGNLLLSKYKYNTINNGNTLYVWTGRPIHTATVLSENANKYFENIQIIEGVNVIFHLDYTKKQAIEFYTIKEFEKKIKFTNSPKMKYMNNKFSKFFASSKNKIETYRLSPILISKAFYKDLKLINKDKEYMKNIRREWRMIEGINENVYGWNIKNYK